MAIGGSVSNNIFQSVVRNNAAKPLSTKEIKKKNPEISDSDLSQLESKDGKPGVSLEDLRAQMNYTKQQISWVVPEDSDRVKSQEASGIVVIDDKQLWVGDSGNKNSLFVYDKNSTLLQEIELEGMPNGDWEALTLMENTEDHALLAIWDNGGDGVKGAVREFKLDKKDGKFSFSGIERTSKRPKNIRDAKEFNKKSYNVEAMAYNDDKDEFVAFTKFKAKDLKKKGVNAQGEIFPFKPGKVKRKHVKKLEQTLFDKIGEDWAKEPTDACYYKDNYYVLCHKEGSDPRVVVLNEKFDVESINVMPFGTIKPEGIFVDEKGISFVDEGQAKDVGDEHDSKGNVSKSFSTNISWDYFMSLKK